LGLAAAADGNLRLAIRSLQRALQLRPTDVTLAHQLAMAARTAAGEGYRVVVQLPENLATQPSSTLAEQLAKFVTNEKEFVEAFLSLPPSAVDRELFETLASIVQTALAQNENYADLRYIAAAVQQRLGQLRTATEHANAAIWINPGYVKARVLLADLLCAQGQRAQAAAQLQAAIRYGADWPDIHYRAGQLLFANNQPAQARVHFKRALELNADFKPAAAAMAAWAA
jgi:tetratricopeptide (TPR) repeat protein